MRRINILPVIAFLLLSAFPSIAQSPLSWNFSLEDAGNGEVNIVAKATIQQGWYMYDTHIPDGGPTPTMIEFDNITGAELVGEFRSTD